MLHLCVFLSEPKRGMTKLDEAKLTWNKMEVKNNHVGMDIMVQTFFVKVCYFSNPFGE